MMTYDEKEIQMWEDEGGAIITNSLTSKKLEPSAKTTIIVGEPFGSLATTEEKNAETNNLSFTDKPEK